jgi:hypothetical protein
MVRRIRNLREIGKLNYGFQKLSRQIFQFLYGTTMGGAPLFRNFISLLSFIGSSRRSGSRPAESAEVSVEAKQYRTEGNYGSRRIRRTYACCSAVPQAVRFHFYSLGLDMQPPPDPSPIADQMPRLLSAPGRADAEENRCFRCERNEP